MASWHHRPLHPLAFVLTHDLSDLPWWLLVLLILALWGCGGSQWVTRWVMMGLARSGSGWVAGCFLVGLWGGSRWLTVVEQLTVCLGWL
uniref:Uncharacterized protein n=1 Tax=Fagus sylvatica TaxID=28930 RepID=A0A2N9GT80_FAGSY